MAKPIKITITISCVECPVTWSTDIFADGYGAYDVEDQLDVWRGQGWSRCGEGYTCPQHSRVRSSEAA